MGNMIDTGPWQRLHWTSGFPGGSGVNNLFASVDDVRDLSFIPGSGRSPGEGNGYAPEYSCLENPQGQRSLVGYSPQGHRESDMTERGECSLFCLWNTFHC